MRGDWTGWWRRRELLWAPNWTASQRWRREGPWVGCWLSWTMSTTHYTVLSTDRRAYSVADSCHCHAHRTGWGSPLSPGPFSFLTPRRRGGGGRWTSLHESTSVCPPLLISSHLSPMHRLYHLYILHYHLSLCSLHFPNTHTHTQAQEHYLALSIHTSTRSLYFFALSTPAAQERMGL